MKDAYGLAKRFAAMPPRWGWIKDVARLIEQDRREVRSEERKACAYEYCVICRKHEGNICSLTPADCWKVQAILDAEPDTAKEG